MNSVLFAVATTGTSCGAVNSMHDSFTPLAGMVPLWNLMLGCIVSAALAPDIWHPHACLDRGLHRRLMIGRTPEYLGKRIQAWDATWAIIAIMAPSILILAGSAIACSVPAAWPASAIQGRMA